MTRKLFYENQYEKQCNTTIKEIIKNGNKIIVTLEDSIFYPEGGGQPCDLGFIEDIKVIKVYEKDGIIYNQLLEEPKNNKVKCIVDFERRFDFMQQHTGEHLLSAAFLNKYKGINKGFHLGDEYTTIDIDLPEITKTMEKEVQLEANNYIYKNIPINTFFVKNDEANALPLRSKVKVDDSLIRIVNIENVDMCACCGTHLKTTGEVGIIKIIKIERHKGMSRVYFKCGKRALMDYDKKDEILNNLVKVSATEDIKLQDKFMSLNNKLSELNKKLMILRKKSAEKEAELLISNFKDNIIFKEYETLDFEEVQLISEEVTKKDICFIGVSDHDIKITASHNGYSSINLGEIFRNHIKDYNGKGGGDKKKAQGTFNELDDLKNFSDVVIKKVTEVLWLNMIFGSVL